MGCCSCLGGICLKILVGIVTLLKVAVATAIICIVAIHLYKVDYTIPKGTNSSGVSLSDWTVTEDCQLGTNYASTNLCNYAFAVCGLSLAVSLGVSILLCCTCDLCGLGFVLELALATVGSLWWLAAALVFSSHVKEANDQSIEITTGDGQVTYSVQDSVKNWRTSVVVLSWVCFGLFTFTALVYLGKILGKICKCCGCDDDDGKYKDK